jgi:diaminobutyrate-2-oxoglutarate transaminase
VETSGPRGEVVKLLPPLTIGDDELAEGLRRFVSAVEAVA